MGWLCLPLDLHARVLFKQQVQKLPDHYEPSVALGLLPLQDLLAQKCSTAFSRYVCKSYYIVGLYYHEGSGQLKF